MLGVADLHTPEAIAAAETAIDGHIPVIPLAASSSSSDEDDDDDNDDSSSSDEDDSDDNDSSDEGDEKVLCSPTKKEGAKHSGDESSEALTNKQPGKRPKIVELS